MLLSNRPGRKLLRPKRRTQSPGRRWEASRLPPVAGGRRRASGSGLEPERCRRQMQRGRRVCRGRQVTQLLAARKLPGTTNGRRGPRAFAPPVAEEAKAQCVQRSARSKPAPSGVASAGHRKRARRTVAEDIRRSPQQGNIFAPTPRMKPSACVRSGRSISYNFLWIFLTSSL